jgi:heme-degrading monooxygenase HmoA
MAHDWPTTCVFGQATLLAVTWQLFFRWAQRESKLEDMDGFKAFIMARRDGDKAGDSFNYQSITIWRDRTAFEAWVQSQQFANTHGAGKVRPAAGCLKQQLLSNDR